MGGGHHATLNLHAPAPAFPSSPSLTFTAPQATLCLSSALPGPVGLSPLPLPPPEAWARGLSPWKLRRRRVPDQGGCVDSLPTVASPISLPSAAVGPSRVLLFSYCPPCCPQASRGTTPSRPACVTVRSLCSLSTPWRPRPCTQRPPAPTTTSRSPTRTSSRV